MSGAGTTTVIEVSRVHWASSKAVTEAVLGRRRVDRIEKGELGGVLAQPEADMVISRHRGHGPSAGGDRSGPPSRRPTR